MKRISFSLAVTAALIGSLLSPLPAHAADGVPTFNVEFIAGAVGPVDANDTGTIVGAGVVTGTNNRNPWISIAGGPWSPLPVPTGASSTYPVAVNNSGMIAGNSVIDGQFRAIRWVPGPGGYAAEVLPWLTAYGTGSAATGINDAGQIVGARASVISGAASSFGWLYGDADGLVDLLARTGYDLTPADINNAGQVLNAAGVLDLTSWTITPLPPAPAGYYGVSPRAMNDTGRLVGDGPSVSQSLPNQGAFLGNVGGTWERVDFGSSVFGADVNALGDASWTVQAYSGAPLAPKVFLAGFGSLSPGDLLSDQARTAGWLVTGGRPQLTSTRTIVVTGRNTITGQVGTLVLTPSGQTIPVPVAPTGLTATPRAATATFPWVSIELAWSGSDPNTRSYEVQRALAGTGSFATITSVTGATTYRDRTVLLGTAYDYRVRAVGLSGASEWTGVATATAPAQGYDGTAPVVSLSGPANGSTVSGEVTLVANASDNVAVTSLWITVTNPLTGVITEVGRAAGGGPLTVQWDTAGLPSALFPVYARAADANGNTAVTVLYLRPVASPAYTMRVSTLDLRATLRRGTVTATGTATVVTQTGVPVAGVSVTATWSTPGGVRQESLTTDSLGRVRFVTSGSPGTYQITISDAIKNGYTWDRSASVLTKSVTK